MTKTLYIIKNSISEKVFNKIQKTENYHILALDINLKKLMKEKGFNILEEKDFLDFNDYDEIDNTTLDLSRNWFLEENIKKSLEFHNFNIGMMLQNEFYQIILKHLHQIRLIRKILSNLKPDLVYTVFSDNTIGKIPYYVSKSNNITTKILDDKKIKEFNKFDSVNFSINILGKNLDISLSKKQFEYLKKINGFYWDKKYNFKNNTKIKSQHSEKTILFLDFNLSWHEKLLDKFKERDYKLLFYNNRRPTIWNKKSLEIAKKLNIEKVSLNEVNLDGEYSEFITNFRKQVTKTSLEKLFKFDDFDYWGIFSTELEKIIEKRAKDILIRIVKVENLLKTRKIDAMWTLDDWGDDRTIVSICHKNKIPVCILLSGSIAIQKPEEKTWICPSILGERIADKLCVWGENDKNNYMDFNLDINKIEIGGAPKYDNLFQKKTSDENYILILTGGFPSTQNSYFLSTSVIEEFEDRFRKTLYELKKFQHKIIIKRHPTQGPQEIIDLPKIFSEIIPDAVILKDTDTIDLISKSKIVISMQSTVIEESIILGKPIIYLPYIKNDKGIPYSELGAVVEVFQPDEVHEAIQNCLFDENTKEKLFEGRKKFLEKIFSYQNSASNRHIDIMEKLIEDFKNEN